MKTFKIYFHGYSRDRLENQSSKQFTELKNIKNWANKGQKSIFLKTFLSSSQKSVCFYLTWSNFNIF